MDSVSRDVRMDVALILYEQYKKLVARPGHSPKAREALDHALTLVLNVGRRAESQHQLLRNVRRDARRVLHRQNSARPEHEQFEAYEETIGSSLPNPEEVLLAKECARLLEVVALELGPDGAACARGLVEDESIEECASRTKLPARRVRYLRALIRSRLPEHLTMGHAA